MRNTVLWMVSEPNRAPSYHTHSIPPCTVTSNNVQISKELVCLFSSSFPLSHFINLCNVKMPLIDKNSHTCIAPLEKLPLWEERVPVT